MELSQAIVNMEQGGSADGLLQVHALYVYVMPKLFEYLLYIPDLMLHWTIFRSGLIEYNQI